MPKKKIEVPVSDNIGLHMEFLEGEAEETPPIPQPTPEPIPEPAPPIPLVEKADCALCIYGPPEEVRAMEECIIASRRGNANHCTKFVRKV